MLSLQERPNSQNCSGTAEHVFLPEMSTAEWFASLGETGLKFHFFDTAYYNGSDRTVEFRYRSDPNLVFPVEKPLDKPSLKSVKNAPR